MVLESTMICVDNSDYMRNGDFLPTRLQAQQDAVNLVCHSKTRANPENNVGLLTLANVEVLATLTSDVGRILSKLHQVEPNGNINLVTGIRIAHLERMWNSISDTVQEPTRRAVNVPLGTLDGLHSTSTGQATPPLTPEEI
uniref:26S proteasome non-ATPase regulatory subunit 4 n=1 Tax=Timema cristinae TaxID=61476 RepID=A0A7R9CDY3_TIMCR|nr:unnamed protein product [Timema cristinae]